MVLGPFLRSEPDTCGVEVMMSTRQQRAHFQRALSFVRKPMSGEGLRARISQAQADAIQVLRSHGCDPKHAVAMSIIGRMGNGPPLVTGTNGKAENLLMLFEAFEMNAPQLMGAVKVVTPLGHAEPMFQAIVLWPNRFAESILFRLSGEGLEVVRALNEPHEIEDGLGFEPKVIGFRWDPTQQRGPLWAPIGPLHALPPATEVELSHACLEVVLKDWLRYRYQAGEDGVGAWAVYGVQDDDTRKKPVVRMLPIFDHTQVDVVQEWAAQTGACAFVIRSIGSSEEGIGPREQADLDTVERIGRELDTGERQPDQINWVIQTNTGTSAHYQAMLQLDAPTPTPLSQPILTGAEPVLPGLDPGTWSPWWEQASGEG